MNCQRIAKNVRICCELPEYLVKSQSILRTFPRLCELSQYAVKYEIAFKTASVYLVNCLPSAYFVN